MHLMPRCWGQPESQALILHLQGVPCTLAGWWAQPKALPSSWQDLSVPGVLQLEQLLQGVPGLLPGTA